jgi:nitroreductase
MEKHMATTTKSTEITSFLRDLRQTRKYTQEPVPEEVLNDILEVARWTGSSKNSQPWHFLVVREPATLQRLSELGNFTSFVAGATLAIAVVLDGKSPSAEWYDEGRAQERLMLAGKAHGLGSGTAWYSSEEAQQQVREVLGVPAPKVVRSVVAFGYPLDPTRHEKASVQGGRRPLAELVRYERFDFEG